MSRPKSNEKKSIFKKLLNRERRYYPLKGLPCGQFDSPMF